MNDRCHNCMLIASCNCTPLDLSVPAMHNPSSLLPCHIVRLRERGAPVIYCIACKWVTTLGLCTKIDILHFWEPSDSAVILILSYSKKSIQIILDNFYHETFNTFQHFWALNCISAIIAISLWSHQNEMIGDNRQDSWALLNCAFT